ncbi:MAG: 16S rRNA (cytidine(1402)-2'-O)-methyltransferase [Burkholderiaceae bacterium]|nr:16S rRNA (cytidine(1402)-2'-O)-methyltransferase [Burkholderiaceae bacterium]
MTKQHPTADIMQDVARQHFPASALYVIATPIGNRGDMTCRALYCLAVVDAIACEDTRVTGALLAQYGVKRELVTLHRHNERAMTERLLARLAEGNRIALLSDAGTPTVSDPGARLVDAVLTAGFRVVPMPGPSAAIAALSVSGFRDDHFYFVGFLPSKGVSREALLRTLSRKAATLVMYEAPHRVAGTLQSLARVFEPDRRIVIAREMTKLFEEVHRCPVSLASDWLMEDPNRERGEFVLLVEGAKPDARQEGQEAERILSLLLEDCPVSQAVSLASRITGVGRKSLYERALQMQIPLPG